MSLRKPTSKAEENTKKSPKRPSDDTKSLSSLSSISSSPSPSRSRSRSPNRNRRRNSVDRNVGRYHGGTRHSRERHSRERHLRDRHSRDRHSRERVRGRTRSRSRSCSIQPLRERDKWDKYREQIRRAEETLDRALKFHEKNPEKHPSYPDEWKKFWNRRYKELQAEGNDPSKHDFKPEWIEFWNKRMREIHNEQLQQRKEEIRKRLELPEDKPPEKWIPPPRRERSPVTKRSRHRVDSDDDVEYVGTKTIKPDYYDRHEIRDRGDYVYPAYGRGKIGVYNHYYPRTATRTRPIHYATPYPVKDKSPTPPAAEETLTEDLEVVGLLRLLTALEGQLGSLGPKIVSLLSKALAAEKAKPNSAEELLFDEDVSVLFETVKEKLKGQLFAGMVEKMAVTATKTAIQNIAKLLHKTSESKKKLEEEKKKKERELLETPKLTSYIGRTAFSRPMEIIAPTIKSEPVSVPGVGTVDKVAIAQEIAAALVAQGKSNVSQEDLETLINAVVGMAEASKLSDKPVTTADFVKGLATCGSAVPRAVESIKTIIDSTERQVPQVENLSDADLKSMLQNFKELSTPEQHSLISFLKKLEASDPSRVEKLRAFVNLGTTIPFVTSASIAKSPTPEIETVISKNRKSISPFSTRKSNQNPSDEDDKWKPKLDMFANDDDDEQQDKKKENDDKTKTKLDLSDDDDDYTFEDIYKAADKNVSENEKAKKSHGSFSKSPTSWSRSRSRSQSRSRSRSRSKSLSTPTQQKETSRTNDPNAILNETKRLIANIMGDLPNKYVPKSHTILSNDKPLSTNSLEQVSSADMGNFYNQAFVPSNQPRPQSQQAPMTYPNVTNQQFPNYQQPQMFPNNSGYMDNSYNYQGYGNMPAQAQYGGPSMPSGQYSQPNYGSYAPSPTAHPSSYVPPPQSQQYDNYMQQQRFY